jgi:PAS domain S-box-containing protein
MGIDARLEHAADDADRAGERLLAAAFERAPGGMAITDLAGRYVRVNAAFERLLGYREAELRGRLAEELTHPEDLAAARRALETLRAGERAQVELERRCRGKDARELWVRDTLAAIPALRGRPGYVLAMVEDITERRRADEQLRESEALLQAFTGHSPAVMFLKDRDGRYRFVNAQFLERFGLKRHQVLGRTDMELFPRAQALAFSANDAKVLARRAPLTVEETARYVEGERVSVVMKFPVLDASGAVTGVGGVATDITERKRTEQALQEQRTLLAEAQKVAGLGCWEWDPASGRVTWSEQLYRIFGVEPQGYRPSFESYLERVHPEDRQQTGAMVARALMDGRPFGFDERILRPDGSLRYLRSRGEVVRDPEGRVLKLLGACFDVTEQKGSEAALREAAASLQALTRRLVEAEEAERRRIARELHDRVGQNLSALNINLDIVLGELGESGPHELRVRLRDSLALVDGTLQTIENVMAELRPPLLDEYGLGAALGWHAEEYSRRTGLAIEFDDLARSRIRDLRPEGAAALFRIAQEALSNIARHANARKVRLLLESDERELALTISDDGAGFDPGAAPATRWGMTAMRERALAAGGQLEIDSAPGRGTTVRAAVPL